jgi:hypothetical protein
MIKWNPDETFLGNVFDLADDLHPAIRYAYQFAVVMFILFGMTAIVGLLGQLG